VYVGRPFGIPVYFDLTWVVLAAYITWAYAPTFSRAGESPGARSYSLAFLVAVLFAVSVLAHELSHSVIARLMNLPVRRVTILFFGGVSEIERDPETPARSYLVSVAGPLMSLLLSALGFLAVMVAGLDDTLHYLVTVFAAANGLVALVNLLPGLPLDGGHVLRAVVWQLTGSAERGTRVAARVGQLLAGAVVAAGVVLATRPGLANVAQVDLFFAAILGAYLWRGAAVELRLLQLRALLPTLDLRRLARRAVAVTADTPLAEALRRSQAAGARALVVVDHGGRPEALVPDSQVEATPAKQRPWVSAGSLGRALNPALVLVSTLTGQPLLDAMRAEPSTEYLVVDPAGTVLGVLVADDVVRALQPQ
jgi:Zn-dependent protease/CBS domain-containing protein